MLFQWTKKLNRKIRLCTWRFNRDLWEFPRGIVMNYWRTEVNQGGSAPFAIKSYGRRKYFFVFLFAFWEARDLKVGV